MQRPVVEGYRATEALRQAGYRRRIIALTAHAMEGERERCLGAGCDDYLSKPISGEELLMVVQRHVGSQYEPAAKCTKEPLVSELDHTPSCGSWFRSSWRRCPRAARRWPRRRVTWDVWRRWPTSSREQPAPTGSPRSPRR